MSNITVSIDVLSMVDMERGDTMQVWIERIGPLGENELYAFGPSWQDVSGRVELDVLGNGVIRRKHAAFSEKQMAIIADRIDGWIRDLGSCQLSCISAPDKEENAPERRCRWKPRAADLRPLELPMRSLHIASEIEEWSVGERWL